MAGHTRLGMLQGTNSLKERKQMKIAGLPVVDAKRRITIHISKTDVKNGKNKNPAGCAAALAVMHDIKSCTQARVHLSRTYVKIGRKWIRYQTPDSLRGEIVSFDRGGGFDTGKYVLSPMPPANRFGKHTGSQKGKNRPKHLHKKRAKYKHVSGVRHFGANR